MTKLMTSRNVLLAALFCMGAALAGCGESTATGDAKKTTGDGGSSTTADGGTTGDAAGCAKFHDDVKKCYGESSKEYANASNIKDDSICRAQIANFRCPTGGGADGGGTTNPSPTDGGGATDTGGGGADGGGGGSVPCPNALTCANKCPQNDQNCIVNCINADGPTCGQCIQEYQTCVQQNGCVTGQNVDQQCAQTKCGAQLEKCFPAGGGGGGGSTQDQCIQEKCGDKIAACVQGASAACPNLPQCAQGCGNDNACFEKCVKDGGPACEACVAEVNKCVEASGCVQGGGGSGFCAPPCNNPSTQQQMNKCPDGKTVCVGIQGGTQAYCVPEQALRGQPLPPAADGETGGKCDAAIKCKDANSACLAAQGG